MGRPARRIELPRIDENNTRRCFQEKKPKKWKFSAREANEGEDLTLGNRKA
jgi:hypothetical protein